jgi:hypothetical protein
MNQKHYLLVCFTWLATLSFGQMNTWDQKEAFVVKRERAASFSIGGIGYVCAGLDTVVREDLWQYDPAFDAWTQLADLPSTQRRNPVAFSVNGKGYVGTGHSGQYSATGIIQEEVAMAFTLPLDLRRPPMVMSHVVRRVQVIMIMIYGAMILRQTHGCSAQIFQAEIDTT